VNGEVAVTGGDDVEDTAQEALKKARDAERDCRRGEVVRLCNVALEAIEKLPDDLPHRKLKAEVLQLKGNAVGDLDREAALKCFEEVLAIKKETGSKAEYASFLAFTGERYSFAGRKKESLPPARQAARGFPIRYVSTGDPERSKAADEEALRLFEELGDKGGQAAILTRRGAKALCGDPGTAMRLFERAMPLFAESGGHKLMAGVCRAGISLLKEVERKTPSRLMVRDLLYYGITCDRFRRETAGVVCLGGDGFLFGGKGTKPWEVNLFRGLDLTKKAGDTWSLNVRSYTYHPLCATSTFESDSETVETPAGKFFHCWRIRSVTVQPSAEARDDVERWMMEKNKGHCGTRERWYAPGVGLVKYRADQENGLKATVELAGYSIHGDRESYLPLAVGNWWEYKLTQVQPAEVEEKHITEIETGEDGSRLVRSYSTKDPHEIFDKDRYEVFDLEENVFYMSRYQYAYRRPAEYTKPGAGQPG
jgi:hypothetical protein